MLEPSQSIKSTQSFNATQSQKVIELESESVDQDYGEETPFATVKKKSDFLKPLIRKKRADDEIDLRPYSDKLAWDNKLQLIWYGENKKENLNRDYDVFNEKIQRLLQDGMAKASEKSAPWLTERAYPTDYELGCLSSLVYEEGAGYKLLSLADERIETLLKSATDRLDRLKNYLESAPTLEDKKTYQAEQQKILTKHSALLKKQTLKGWKLLGIASHPAINNGYVGAVYWHALKKHIVIAHRGTDPKNLGAQWTDFQGILNDKAVYQMSSASTFSQLVIDSLLVEIKSVSFTGHSLGGWLAQITTFSSAYLERSGEYFKKRDQPVYHPHTVVFDSPGCQPMLLRLKRAFDLRYGVGRQHLNIHALDIQIYLSSPNTINTCNPHVGTIYRLFPTLQDTVSSSADTEESARLFSPLKNWMKSQLMQNSFLYTLNMHSLDRILKAWPKNEEMPTEQEVQSVQDWPIWSKLINDQEYGHFFELAKEFNNYHLKDKNIVTKSGFVIRYRTQPVDFSSTSMHIFTPEERQFLGLMKILQDWFIEQKGHLEPELNELNELKRFFQDEKLEESTIAEITQAFKGYTLVNHGERLQAREPGVKVAPVINGLKQLLRRYPKIIDVVKREVEKRPTLIQAIYAAESDSWINNLQDQIDLRWEINRDRLNLVKFLSDKDARVLHITVDSEEMKLVLSQLAYDLLTAIAEKEDGFLMHLSIEEKMALTPYTQSEAVTFLSVEQIRLQQHRGFALDKFYQSEKSPPLLWLDGELNDKEVWQTELFNGSLEKKIIVLTKREGHFYQFLNNKQWRASIYCTYHSKAFDWLDLTVASRQQVLERVTIQGEKSLAKLTGFDTLLEISTDTPNEKLTALNKILDIKTLIKLINNRIDIGSLPERFTHLETSYVKSRDRLVLSKLKGVLLNDLLKEETTRYIIISGVFDPNLNVVKDKLIQYFGLIDGTAEAGALKNKVDFYDIPEPGNKRIFIVNNQFKESAFKEFCRDYNPLGLRVDWVHWEKNQFILKYFYDTEFYTNRKFYYKNQIIIDTHIKDKEVSIQIEKDLFVFSDVKFEKRPKFITWLKNIQEPFALTMAEYLLEQFKSNAAISTLRIESGYQNQEVLFKRFSQMGAVHWLRQDEQGLWIWQCSEGSLESLYQYIDEARTNNRQELLSEQEFIKKINNKVALIIDEPGMGKTTVLTKLSSSMLESSWVIRINLRNCEEAIQQLSSVDKFKLDEVIEFLVATDRSGLDSDLAKNLMRYKLQYPQEGLPLLLLFDGFDEIKNDKKGSKKKISLLLNFLKDRVATWVTAREIEIKTLQNSLLVFDTKLKELDLGEQKEFLKKFWRARLFLTLPQNEGILERKSQLYIEALLKEVNSAFRLDNSRFIGIPLHLRLLGEGFQEGFKAFINDETSSEPRLEDISVLGLYEKFIDVRYRLFLEKESMSDGYDFLRESVIRDLNKLHRRLAFYQLLDDDVEIIEMVGKKPPFLKDIKNDKLKIDDTKLEGLFRVGLVQPAGDNGFGFIHKSFAEYFVADLLIGQLKKTFEHHKHGRVQKHLLTNILIKPEHQLIRIFLDEKLAKGMALPPQNLAEYADAIEIFLSENLADFFNEQGKTALHIAVEERHLKIFDYLLGIFRASPERLIGLFSARDRHGETALYLAVKEDRKEYVRKFLDSMADFSDSIKEKLLLATIFRTNEDDRDPVIKKLFSDYIEQYPELKVLANKIKNNWGLIAFFLEAAEDKLLSISDFLTKHSISKNEKTYLLLSTNKYQATALGLAIMTNNKAAIKALLDQAMDCGINMKVRYEISSVQKQDSSFQYEITPLPYGTTSSPYGVTPLQIAVSKRQKDTVIQLLEAGAKVNVGQPDRTPLYIAATLDDEDMVKDLLYYEAEVDVQVPTGETPLYWAAFHDNQRMVDSLLENYAEVNIQTSDGYTPLYWAVSQNNEEMVVKLLEAGAAVNVGYGDNIPLYVAVRNNNAAIVRHLLAKDALSDIKGDNGSALLFVAIRDNLEVMLQDNDGEDRENVRNVVEWLLTYGSDINAKENGYTPLYWAVRHGDEPIVETLLEWGADVNVQLPNGETPLYWAVKKDRGGLVKRLLDEGALTNIEVKEGNVIYTLLSVAREHQNKAIESMLLASGAQDNIERDHTYQAFLAIRTNDKASLARLLQRIDVDTMYAGKTLLHWALTYARYEMAESLLDAKANVNKKTVDGNNALYLAIKHGLDDVVKTSVMIEKLLNRDADINVVLKNNEPLLCWLIRKSFLHKDVRILLKQLLKRNPNVNLQSRERETPLYLAIRYAFHDVVNMLLERDISASIDVELVNGETPLYWAVRNEMYDVVDTLLKRGARTSVNVGLDNGETPLYWAVRRNSLRLVEKLLEYGASDSLNEKVMEKTTVGWAIHYKNEAIVGKLLRAGANRKLPGYLKRYHDKHNDYLIENKRLKQIEGCLPGPSGYKPPDRSRRSIVEEGCEISWNDVDEFNEEKERLREWTEIKINSDKFLDKLKNPTLSGIKRDQLLQLVDKVSVIGKSKEQVDGLVKNQKILMQLQKVGYLSGLTMQGMMAKNILSDFLQGNYDGVAINLGFIMGDQGFANLAKASSTKGMQFVLNEQRLLGQSLKLAAPFLARGTSGFIAYDLVNQIKAYKEGNPDAVVGIIGDGIYLSVGGVEIGIELAEMGNLLQGVSSITGPIGTTVNALVFIGTDVYLAIKQIHQIDSLIHLTATERITQSLRAFIGMDPEHYVQKIVGEKRVNTELAVHALSFLEKNNTNIQRYIFSTMDEKIVCYDKPVDQIPYGCNYPHRGTGAGMIGIACGTMQQKTCHTSYRTNLDNTILLDNKRKDIRWSRTKPDVAEGNLFCAPVGDDIEIPSAGAYFCSKAMGVEWPDSRTGNITFFELGDGNDRVVGFPDGNHVVELGNGHKDITLGQGDDVFFLTGELAVGSLLDGGGGINTLDVTPRAHPISFIQMNDFERIQNYLLRENKYDTFIAQCGINYIDGRGGESEEKLDIIHVVSHDGCAYFLKILLRPYTDIQVSDENKASKFVYIVPIATRAGEAILSLGQSQGVHQFVFAYGLSDIRFLRASIMEKDKKLKPASYAIKFEFEKNTDSLSSEPKHKLSVNVFCTSNNNISYILGDNTEIKLIGNDFYAFQNTNRLIHDLINDYSAIAERLNLPIFVQSLLTNETMAIGHKKNVVLHNNPYYRSHLVGNGGENIFVIRSGYAILDKSKLPIPEVILYDKDDDNLTDTLDLREIKNQLQEDLETEIQVRVSTRGKDILFELFTSQFKEESLARILLSDASITNWYKRLHIIINNAPMVLEGLDLKPVPLEFDSNKEIIIINPEDVEENTKLVIAKKSDNHRYLRLGNNLIISNILTSNLTNSERYTLLLQNFYKAPKLRSLAIQFTDKEIVLRNETAKISKAKDFVLEYKRYDRAIYNTLFNRNLTEEDEPTGYRALARRSHGDIDDPDADVGQGIWGALVCYLLPAIAGVVGILGLGMSCRNQMRARLRANAIPVVHQAAIAVPLLAPVVEAQSMNEEVALANLNKNRIIQMGGCVLGARYGDKFVPGVTCHTKNYQTMIFLKDNDVKLLNPESKFFRESCRPIEFNDRPSVHCEGKETNIVYTPEIFEPPLERINGLLMLCQVGLHEGKKLYHWLQNFFSGKTSEQLPQIVSVTTEQKTIWIELLVDIETRLTHLDKTGKVEDELGWIRHSLEDRKEEYKALSQKPQASLADVTAMTENLKALQEELEDMMATISTFNSDDKQSGVQKEKEDVSNDSSPWVVNASLLAHSTKPEIRFKPSISQSFFKEIDQATSTPLSLHAVNSTMINASPIQQQQLSGRK